MPRFYSVTSPHKNSTPRPVVVILGPGMGGDRNSPALVSVANALSQLGITTLRFDFAYKMAGKKSPDSESLLISRFHEAIEIGIKKCAGFNPKATSIKVVIGGRSMGGRIASTIAAEQGREKIEIKISASRTISAVIAACIFLSYPLHAPGKKERKDQHFSKIVQKCLFVSGDRDPFATPAELKSSAKKITGTTTCTFVKDGDHELKTRKDSPVSFEDNNAILAKAVAAFLSRIK